MVENPEDWFSHDAAHLLLTIPMPYFCYSSVLIAIGVNCITVVRLLCTCMSMGSVKEAE